MMSRTTGYIDLHNKSVKEAMEKFVEYYNYRVAAGNLSEIEVQHGWGSSGEGGQAICNRLRGFLSNYPDHVAFATGYDRLDNYDSKTFVYPKKQLPASEDRLAEKITEFCKVPKTEEKILGKFCRYGIPTVHNTLIKLIAQGVLQENVKKFKYKVYEQSG